eukprot:3327826-Rhodomonas_salina.1
MSTPFFFWRRRRRCGTGTVVCGTGGRAGWYSLCVLRQCMLVQFVCTELPYAGTGPLRAARGQLGQGEAPLRRTLSRTLPLKRTLLRTLLPRAVTVQAQAGREEREREGRRERERREEEREWEREGGKKREREREREREDRTRAFADVHRCVSNPRSNGCVSKSQFNSVSNPR